MRWTSRPLGPLLTLLLLSAAGCRPSTPPPAAEASPIPNPSLVPLEIGARYKAHVSPSSAREFLLPLKAGEGFLLQLEQRGLDVVVELFAPEGDLLVVADNPLGSWGPEVLCAVAEQGGDYRVRIRPFQPGDAGDVSLALLRRSPADASTMACGEAARSFRELERRLGEQEESDSDPFALGERVQALWQAADLPGQQALTLRELARLASREGGPGAQLGYLERALRLLDAAGEGVADGIRALLVNESGVALRALGRVGEAEAAFEQAQERYHEEGNPLGEAVAQSNRALVIKARGDIHEAIRLERTALTLLAPLDEERSRAILRLNLGVAYSELGRFAQAFDELEAARAAFESLQDAETSVRVLIALGWTHYLARNPKKAEPLLEEAVERSRQAGLRTESGASDRLGTVLRQLGRFEEAEAAYHHALATSTGPFQRRDVAHTTANLGWLYVVWGHPEAAREKLEQARRELEVLGEPDPLAYVEVGLAQASRGLGQLEEALRHMEIAAGLVESMRLTARGQGELFAGAPLLPDYDELHVDLLMELAEKQPAAGHDGRALALSDLSRARSLYELLVESRVDIRSGAPAELLTREREIERRLATARLERTAAAGGVNPETGRLEEIDHRLRSLLMELETVRAELRAANPELAELREPAELSLTEIRGLLDPDTGLLSYALGEKRSFLFLLTLDTFKTWVLPGREELEESATAVYEAFSTSRVVRPQAGLIAESLAAALVAPALPHLGVEKLLVVPQGRLHLLPFGALPLPGGAPGELLLDRFEVDQLPSAASLWALRRRGTRPWQEPETVAVIADPVFSLDDPRFETSGGADPLRSAVDRLPFSRREAEVLERFAGPRLRLCALGFDARRDLVADGELSGISLVHFATHAEIDEAQPELTRLLLSRVGPGGEPLDGEVRLHEIYALDLQADLVVLSGCRTALGEMVRGEGLMGLPRGFFYAGASRLLVSLWPVADEATSNLMEHFYQALFEEHLTPLAALRRAQQAMRSTERWQAPYYWAGFVLQGEPR